MGRDLYLTKEELESADEKKKLLKAPISYKSDDLEIPDLDDKFKSNKIKKTKKIKIEVVDMKIKKKNKSNKLL